MAKKKKKKELGTSSARQEKVALKQAQKKSVSSTPKTTYSAKSNSAPVKKTASVEKRINTQATTDATRKNNPQRSVVKPNNSLSNSSASRISQANNYLKENRSALSSRDYYSLKRDVNAAAKRNAGNWDGMKMITRGGFTKKEQEKLKKAREKQGRKAIGDADYNAKGEGNRGSAAKTKKKEATGTEKLRKLPSWNQTQEERFLNQRQYQRTQADKSADKLKSKAANAKDAAETEVSVFKNYGKYVDAASRHAKENVEKYKQTGDAKYLKDAKQEVDLGKVFQKRQQGKIADINRTQEEYVFHQTNLNYDKYLKDTNPEYKFQSKLNDSDKSNNEKRQSAETWAEKTYKDKFSDLSDEVSKKSLKDEAERLASLENPTEVQQAEIRVLRGYYDKLPAAEKDRRIQDALYAKSGTTISRITQSVGAGAEEALAGIMRLPRMLDDTTTEVMEQFGIDDDPRTEKARRAEAGYSKFLDWLDEKADKLESKSEQHRANAARNTIGLGKAAVDLGIVATQIAGDMATGGPARALLSMGARVAGSTYNEAKDRGADTGEALAYAGLQAGKEVLTEKIFGAALPFYGKGLASNSVEKMVGKAIDKAAVKASSKAGERAVKTFLTSVANFAEEGAEEGISGVFDPLVTAITIGGKDDLKQYGKQEFWDDVAYQVVLGGAAGVLGGTMEIARNRAPGVDEQTKTELRKEKATKEQQRALNSFVPNRMSEFAQGLVNTGIKTSTAVNTDGVLRKLEDGDPVDDKDIRNTIKQLNPKKDSGKRALDAIGNRFGIDNLSSMEKESDIVKAIRDGAKTVKNNADTAIETAVQSAETEQQMADIQSRVEEASRDVETAPLTERKIEVEGIGEVGFDTFREELLKYNPNVTEDQVMQGWAQAVQLNGIEPENTDALDALSEPAPQIEGQMDLFGEMGRTDAEEAKFLEDTFGIKQEDSGQMNMFEAMDDDTFKEQTFGIKKQKDEMETLAEETQRKQNSVLEKNEAADKLAPETQEDLNTLAGNIGYRIEVHDHIDDPRGAADMENAIINGYIDKDTGTIHIAMDATDDIETTRSRILKVVAIHETTHGLETLAPEEYQAYSDYVENNWDVLNDGEDFATALENKMKQYADAGQDIGEIGARQELMAEFASHMDQDAVFHFVSNNPTVGQKIVDMWKSIVAKLRETFGMSGDAGEALRRWETAYRAATAKTIRAQDTQAVRDSANSNVEIVDNNGEFIASNDGNGHMMFSVSTLGLSDDETTFTGVGGQVVEDWIANQEDLSDERKKTLKDGLIAIYKAVKPLVDSGEFEPFTSWSNAAVRLDNEGNPIISVVTPNDEYEMNLDHGSVCVKRQTLDAVIEELVRRGSFNDFKMDGPDIVEINRIIGENNFDVTCSICFVEQRRYRQVKLAEEFSGMYNEFVRGMMPEGTEATYFNYGRNQRLDEHNATVTNDVSKLSNDELNLNTKYSVERSEKDENGKTKTVKREMTLQELKDEKNDNGGLRQGVDNKIARYLLASPETRHLLDRGDFAYAGAFDNAKESSPKVKLQEGTDTVTDIESLFVAKGGAGRPLPSHNPTQYLHEMLADEDKFKVEEAFRIGGVRRQSASDFIPHMFFDYAEEVFDLEARGLPEHTYAKVPSYVWLFGLTREKMNMSFIPAIVEDGVAPGLDAEGNYAWLEGQTFPEEEAYKIADTPGYTKNCGPTAVGASDPHIEKMLDDDRISMIIPYHKSNANPVVAAMNGTSYMVDYTGYQNTRHQDGTKLSASEAKKVPNYNELLRQYAQDDNDAPKKAAEDYVRWCEDRDYLPKFDQFAYAKDENGDYIVNEDGRLAVRDGYYKVLTDFKLYDKDGNYCPQEAVKQKYPDNLEEILRDALKGETELEENRRAKVSSITDTVENVLRNDLRQKALTNKEVEADKARVKALNDENTARYKAEQEKRRAALQSRGRKTAPTNSGAVQYSLTPVPPVQNTSDTWRPGATFDEVKAAHPNLYDTEGTEEEVSNKTQIQGTKKTYDKVLKALIDEGFTGSILDASSGLGLGTELGKEYGKKYGFTMEDIEPYPNLEKHTPDYTDYSTLNKKYDFIISNAVLNVVPQDQRDALVVKMGELLNDGGRMFINVRGKDVLSSNNKEAINEDLMEYYIPGSRSYQKGFTRQELKAYLEDALGEGYRVETDMGAFKTSGVPVLVYKEGMTAQYSLGSPRTSNSVLGQNNTVPTEEEIKSGSATYGGLPIVYHPEMKADARNMDTEVWVSDKFFNDPDQQHILNHEVAHNLSDELMSMHTDDWQEFASNFIEEKQTPPSSSAYANGNRTYWEGLYGDIGATALSETTTQSISEYLDDPERLRQRSEDAYEVIDNFMRSREDNTQFSISNENNKTNEALRKMYESLGLSPHAQPMELRPNAKPQQSKVNTNTFTNTGIFELATEEIEDDELKTRAKNAGKQVKERGKYDRVSEQESMATAKTRLETDYEGEKRKLSDETREWTGVDLDTAMGIASSELAKGNIDEFDKWTDIIQRMGTRAGQLIQAFAKYSRTPEGVAVQAKKALDELGKVNPEKKAELKETVNRLTKQLQAIQKGDLNALIDQFLEQAKIRNTKVNEKKVRREFANATWQRDYNRVVTQLLAIPTDYIKASKGQKVATYQTLSHLLNLRTNNRNILSNFVFGEVETLANDLATIPDFFIGLATGKRTVGLEGPGLAPKALKAGLERGRQTALDVRADIMPLDSDTKYGTTRRTWKKASRNPLERGMSNLEMILGYELNVTDEFAKGQHETRIRKGLQKWVDKGMYSEEVIDQFAEQEMLYRTFQDDTFLGTVLAGIKNHLNYIGFGHTGRYLRGNKYEIKEFGLGDLVQKYTTVPGALGTRVVEYSPVGYMKMFYNMAQLHEARKNLKTEMAKEKPGDKRLASIETDLLNYQRALALSMSRATTGSGLVIGLYLLKGLIKSTPDSGDDDDEKNAAAIRTLQGLSGTQINISALGRLIKREDNAIDWRDGDTLYDLTFLEPMNGLMDISAQMVQDEDVESLKDEDFWKDLFGNSLESIYETFMDLPTMQQLNSIQMELRYHDDDMMKTIPTIGLELMKGSASGFVPAPVRQMAQARDEYYRETYQSQDLVDNTRDALMNSIPGLREKLPTKQDSYGRDKEQEFLRRRALNAFVNPGKTSTYKVSPLEKEIADIASSTDNEYKLYPDRKAPKKLSFGSKKELTNAEKRKYMQILGGTYTSEMNDLIQSEDYKEASASEKEKMMLDRRTFADMEAKAKLAEAFKTTYSKTGTVDKILAHRDMGYSDKQWDEIEKGMTNPESGSVNQEYAKPYLDSRDDLTKAQKAEIWRAMGWVDYDKKGKKKNPYL